MKLSRIIRIVILFTLLAACSGGSGESELSNEDAINTIVAATLQANDAESEDPAATGSISGALSYPSEGIPPLTVVAFQEGSEIWFAVDSEQNQTSYQIDDLPVGQYTVVAYVSDANYGGGYTQAVPCGLSADCSDHSLIVVEVSAGQITDAVDAGDWYAGEDAFPANPAAAQSNETGTQENVGYGEGTASIAGSLGYPSEGIPPLTVAAFQIPGYDWYAVNTEQNQTNYQINNLPGGQYIVVAYVQDEDFAGGYSEAVPCGLSADCSNHELIFIEVGVGQEVTGIDPIDWYAGEDAFPKNPVINQELGIGKGYGIVQNAEEEGIGSIAGSLSYPSSFIPALQVTAFNVETGFWWYVLTVQNQSSYQLNDLPNGDYYVVAYPVGELEGGGYSAAVPCGLSANCSDHSLLEVKVKANEVTEGIDPGDWYAGQGAFPLNPAP